MLALDVDRFTRAALYHNEAFDPYQYCHRPIVVKDRTTTLGDVIRQLKAGTHVAKDQIKNDVVLVWIEQPRILTGKDILERLLTGIGSQDGVR